ncbi:MAG: RagB/SusD family nutrient uptake outer membrane protein [Prevotellaceae bacterium]|jgi:hypothetical protein|nr:RagB/SusD family nutrient uptake outer membrane protein [Prevotellaceae bacterium]
MKKSIIYIMALLGMAWVASCTETTEGFLDSKGKETVDLEEVFADSLRTVQFHAALYWQLSRVPHAPHTSKYALQDLEDYEAATDNSRYQFWSLGKLTVAYTEGNFSQSGSNAGYTLFERSWSECYQTIYRCNMFLRYADEAPLSADRISRMKAEARFLRVFFYYHLLRQYGGVVLMGDEVIDPFNPPLKERASFEACVDYMTAELDACAVMLREVENGADYGRPTKAAAYALQAKIYTLAASPLHNGGNIGTTDANKRLVGYTDYDANRWDKVIKACDKVMALGTHGLVTAADVKGDTRPGIGFYEATTTRSNKERLWFWLTSTGYQYPQGHLLPPSRGGKPRVWPYHDLVEKFPMKNGKAIDETGSGYDADRPYADRDPRLGFTVLFNEAEWIRVVNGEKEPIFTYRGAAQDGYTVNSPTGYYYRKGCRENRIGSTQATDGQGVSFIRYADILLMKAEAMAELNTEGYRKEIDALLFQIRDRAGIEPGSDGRYGIADNLNKEQLLDLIINERRIEFANEDGNRFWDLKRRKLFQRLDGVWSKAAIWDKAGDFYTWQVMPVQRHTFYTKMYFSAIPQREINASHGGLIQNPGW